MLDALRHIDHWLFQLINTRGAIAWLDPIMVLLSSKWIWIPIYIYIVWLLFRRYQKRVWLVLLLLAAVITLSDTISSRVIKPGVQRVRPNKTPDLVVRMPDPKDGNSYYGFVSSHAANSTAIFVFSGLFLWVGWRRFWAFLLVPALVCYSRVYLGVHYPADVFAGALLGAFLAWCACMLYMRLPLKPASEPDTTA
jgi:undecaprenyl-diphosphatase